MVFRRLFSRSPAKAVRRHPGRAYQPFSAYLGRGRLLTRIWTGNGIFVPADDLGPGLSIIVTGRWEPLISDYIVGALEPGDVFIDIGANVGYYTILAGELVKPTGLVVAFEPQEDLAPFIRDSIIANGFQPICHLSDAAIGDDETQAVLGQIEAQSGSASLMPGFGDRSLEAQIVQVRPLDVALQEIGAQRGRHIAPKVIKLDIEGYEYHAWRGMKRTVDAAETLALLIEYAPGRYLRQGQDPLRFLDELEAAGFSLSTLHSGKKGIRKLPLRRDTVQPMIDADSGIDLLAEKGAPYAWS